MVGRKILEHEKALAKAQLIMLERKVNFIDNYLKDNKNKEISIDEANCFCSYLDHTDFDYVRINYEMRG